jgi:hypothetical protein
VIRTLFRHLLVNTLIVVALLIASATLPFASVWLCRDPVGGQIFFWLAPWTCAFWSIIAYNLIGSKFWRGREAVVEWRARRGGYLRSVAKSTVWMFASLFFSYVCEFGVLWKTHSPGWMSAAAYFPVAFTAAWCWRG